MSASTEERLALARRRGNDGFPAGPRRPDKMRVYPCRAIARNVMTSTPHRLSIKVVGLTGGIASGKSTVGQFMADQGIPVIDADKVAREIVEPGSPVLHAIRDVFGAHYIQAEGTLDRQALGALVFSNPEALLKLNALTHPAILERVQDELLKLQSRGFKWAIYEAALIIERGLNPQLESLVVVLCDPETQVKRLEKRNGLDAKSARQRIDSQTNNKRRREAADHVIENSGSLEALKAQTLALTDTLQELLGPLKAP